MNPIPVRALLFCIPVLLTAVGGCNSGGQRALPMVQESAQRALAREDYQLAATEYREVVMRKPGYWQERFAYAKALLGAGKPAAAREQMEIVYTSKPNRFDVLDMLAKTMLASGDVESMARVMKDEAYSRGGARDWLRYGWFMAQAGDADEAERALKRSAEIDRGQNAGPQMALAELYRAAGDQSRAIERLRMAQYCEPKNEEVASALEALGQDPNPRLALVPSERGLPGLGKGEKPELKSITVQ